MTDPIADMITRIRNASHVGLETVVVPASNLKTEVAQILKKEGYISDFLKKGRGVKKLLEVTLRYEVTGRAHPKKSVIAHIERVSKPGRRVYVKSYDLKPVLNGFGIAIISTPKGLMTDKDARKVKQGGEVLVKVW